MARTISKEIICGQEFTIERICDTPPEEMDAVLEKCAIALYEYVQEVERNMMLAKLNSKKYFSE